MISRIAHVALGVPDTETAIEFYGDLLGLAPIERSGDSVFLSTGTSPSFELELGPYAQGVDHFAFGVRGRDALETARARLADAGVAVEEKAAAGEPGLGGGIACALPSGHVLELVAQTEPQGFITSTEAAPRHHGVAGPAPLEHITLLTDRIRETAELLVDCLGFRITDSWQPAAGEPWRHTWLRAGEHHHDLALLPGDGPAPELSHFCFAVPSVAELVRVADALAARGMPLDASIGRHAAGNNVVLYFKDPFGNRLEVNAEMARIDPAAPPRIVRDGFPFDLWRDGRPPSLEPGSACRDGRPLAAEAER
ncbi:MAG: VOC family protein [Solirubrobacterales bacterium]